MHILTTEQLTNALNALQQARDTINNNGEPDKSWQYDVSQAINDLQTVKRMSELQALVNEQDSLVYFDTAMVKEHLSKWQEKVLSAELSGDETALALAKCYVNAYQKVLSLHNKAHGKVAA